MQPKHRRKKKATAWTAAALSVAIIMTELVNVFSPVGTTAHRVSGEILCIIINTHCSP